MVRARSNETDWRYRTIKLAAIKRALDERERRLPRPCLADGTELIGEYEGSGFKQPQYIARRRDGTVLQLPHLLYVVAEACDGERDLREIAEIVSEDLHRAVSVDNIAFIVDEKLRPLGIIVHEDGSMPEFEKRDPLLALKFKQAVIPPSVVNVAAAIFKPLFFPIVIGAVLAWVGVLDWWLFFHHGVAGSVREIIYHPALLVLLLGLLAVSALFHEIGHATACRYGGARPGAMGAGLYIVWPAFYTDVTDAYRLNRVGRLRTDLGGVYFNTIFILAIAGVYFWTGFEPLLVLIALQHIEILHQFVPWIRLDGYYVVSDVTGVPDVMSRVKPTLASMIPGRPTDPRVEQLKPWVRAAVTLYVLTVVPILAVFTVLMILAAPHVLTTAASSGKLEAARVATAFGNHDVLATFVGVVQLLALSLPPAGLVLTLLRLGRATASQVTQRLEPRPRLRNAVVFAAGGAAALFGFNWWSNHPFAAIAAGDRGTIQSAAGALVAHRRPSPTGSADSGPARDVKRERRTRSQTHTATVDTATSAQTTTSVGSTSTDATRTGTAATHATRPAGTGRTSSTTGPAATGTVEAPTATTTQETTPATTTTTTTSTTSTTSPTTTTTP